MIELKGYTHDRTENFFKDVEASKGPSTNGTSLGSKRKGIKQISDKQAEKNKVYEQVKRAWKAERKEKDGFRCEVVKDGVRCSSQASDSPHHKAGRLGAKLCAQELFLACCRNCHTFIHNHPAWSYLEGYMIKRI